MHATLSSRHASLAPLAARGPARGRTGRNAVVAPRALSDVNLTISGATAASLFLGRFVFFEYQKKAAAKAGLPKQNGKTHLEAGDRLAAESSVVSNSGDPAGFTIPLLLGWGALGHVFGYIALATASLTKAGFSALPY